MVVPLIDVGKTSEQCLGPLAIVRIQSPGAVGERQSPMTMAYL